MYGSTMNWSMTENDGKYELGLRYKDSSGVDIDRNFQSDDMTSLVNDVFKAFKKEHAAQTKKIAEAAAAKEKKKSEEVEAKKKKDDYTLQLEKIIKDLTEENNSLKADNAILQRRADDAVNKKPKSNAKVEAPAKDPFDDFFKIWF